MKNKIYCELLCYYLATIFHLSLFYVRKIISPQSLSLIYFQIFVYNTVEKFWQIFVENLLFYLLITVIITVMTIFFLFITKY